MKIVVNHLTRMREGHVCVAGIDLDRLQHVRPVLATRSLTPAVLSRHGGCFDIGHVVDIGEAVARPRPPHVEDHLFNPAAAKFVRQFAAGEFWTLLFRMSRPTLRGLFGDAMKPQGRSSWGTDVGHGAASLGCLFLKRMPRLHYMPSGEYKASIRMHLSDGEADLWAPVTDLRLYRDDHATPDPKVAERIDQRIRKSRSVILGMGLTREFCPSTEARPAHWLQVNNIHLETNPTWQLG
jgi:hypothetical protein